VRSRGLSFACATLFAALAATGCGTPGLSEAGEGDAQRGKELYVEKCGSCHVLEDAGTRGTIGPNLDDAFKQSRVDGLGEDTIRSVVRMQIAYPVEEPPTGATGMPADLVTGEDAESVARYVASVAGRPGQSQGPGEVPSGEEGEAAGGEGIWLEAGCGGCHTMDPPGSTGAVGPNLDESQPSRELTIERVANGRGAMPAFKDSYSEEQIAAVADYVVESTRGG
jgi:mono/diheme cytochrome c family protein